MRIGPQLNNKPYTVSFFGTIALTGATLTYLWSTTFDPAEIDHFFTMFLILLSGVVLSYIFVGFRLMPFSLKTFTTDIISTAISFITVYYINMLVPTELGISPIGEWMFGILAGVAEEWFFRMWLCAWIFKATRSMFMAIPVSSILWAVFHLARYGSNMNLILLVALAGLPLGFFTLYFRSIDGPSFAHMIVNALAGM